MATIIERLVMVVVAVMFFGVFFSTPAYGDEVIDEKVAALLEKFNTFDMAELDETRCAIAAYGADAFPVLMKEIGQSVRAMRMNSPMGGINKAARGFYGPANGFNGPASVLGIMGPEVKTLIPEFIEMLKNREASMVVIFALASLGDDVTPQLLEALKDGDETLSKNALTVFHLMGFQARAATPFVEKMLQSGNERERSRAISVLSRFGEESLPILLKAVDSTSGEMRSRVLFAISNVLTYPQGMPIVENTTMDPDAITDHSKAFLEAARNQGFDADAVFENLLRLLDDPNREVRASATNLLCTLNLHNDELIQRLLNMVRADCEKQGQGEDSGGIIDAHQALKDMGDRSTPAVLKALREWPSEIRVPLIEFLGESKSPDAVRALMSIVGEGRDKLEKFDVRLNEIFMGGNAGIEDEDGEKTGWIELFNPSFSTVSLGGWGLSDDPNKPRKWTFPDVQIEPENALIVMASGKNRTPVDGGELHANFKLNPDGGYLGLCDDSTPPNVVSVIEGGYPAFTESNSYSYFNLDEIAVNVALESLKEIGGVAKEAIPMLMSISSESNLDARMNLASVMLEIAPENPEVIATVAALAVEAEEAGKDQVTIVELVESLKPQGKDSIGKIEPFLKSGEMKMRIAAFKALGSSGPASEVVPILLKCVTDGDASIRVAAMSAIGNLGAAASEAEPALILASQSEVMNEALCAMEALLGIESRSPETLTALIGLINRYWDESEKRDPNQGNASEEALFGEHYSISVFLSGLKPFGLQAKDAIPVLIKYMGDEIVDQHSIEEAFSGMGDAGVSALAVVAKNEDEDLFARCRAVQVLFSLGQVQNSAISSMTEALKTSNRNVRANAIIGLGKLGAAADSAVAALNEALNDADWGNRQRAAVALHNIRPSEFAQPFRVKPWEGFLTTKSKKQSRMMNRISPGIVVD